MKTEKEKFIEAKKKEYEELGFLPGDPTFENEWKEEKARRDEELEYRWKSSSVRKNKVEIVKTNIAIISGILGLITGLLALLKSFGVI